MWHITPEITHEMTKYQTQRNSEQITENFVSKFGNGHARHYYISNIKSKRDKPSI